MQRMSCIPTVLGPRAPRSHGTLAAGRDAARMYLLLYGTNLLQNPCFLASEQTTQGSGIHVCMLRAYS